MEQRADTCCQGIIKESYMRHQNYCQIGSQVVGEKVDISKISRLSSQYQDPASMSFGPLRLGPGKDSGIPFPDLFYIRLL